MSELKEYLTRQADPNKHSTSVEKSVPSREPGKSTTESLRYNRFITDSSKQTVGYTMEQANGSSGDGGKHKK